MRGRIVGSMGGKAKKPQLKHRRKHAECFVHNFEGNMLNASYTTPTASNNKVVSMTTNCLIVRFIGHHPGVE
jgi:hypothetical protein